MWPRESAWSSCYWTPGSGMILDFLAKVIGRPLPGRLVRVRSRDAI